MNYRQRSAPARTHREFSRKSVIVAAVFSVTLGVAVLADAAAVLAYHNFMRSLPGVSLEMGAIITAACIIPLLAMGMSIAEDDMRRHQ
jgi:ABC-type proline/glycine betaine transport system permease subunit